GRPHRGASSRAPDEPTPPMSSVGSAPTGAPSLTFPALHPSLLQRETHVNRLPIAALALACAAVAQLEQSKRQKAADRRFAAFYAPSWHYIPSVSTGHRRRLGSRSPSRSRSIAWS